MVAEKDTYPEVDGAPLNPYDLPGTPRADDDDEAQDEAPTADEVMDVPGPGGEPSGVTTAGDAGADDKPARRKKDRD